MEKIRLSDLQKYKGYTVDDLIVNSISEGLDSTSFNNCLDISSWAGKAKINLSGFTKQDKIEQLISRRHKIVHEADNGKTDSDYKLSSITLTTVLEWVNIEIELVETIERSL